jgi:hypothetical protein
VLLTFDNPIYVPVWLAIVAAIPQIITLVLNFIVVRRTKTTHEAITTLEKNTNGIKDALLTVTGEAEKAKGILEGRAQAIEEIKKTV